ncbi:MAG: recombinase family protein, partial [Thermaerobacter sp.]|nr:recombinase family protein [Thermaerobacter sp.]
HLESFLRHAPDWWQLFLGAPRPQQKTLLKQLVERVTVGPDGFSIDYRVSQEAMASPVALRWRATHRWQSTG